MTLVTQTPLWKLRAMNDLVASAAYSLTMSKLEPAPRRTHSDSSVGWQDEAGVKTGNTLCRVLPLEG